jgi:hypothetical protein
LTSHVRLLLTVSIAAALCLVPTPSRADLTKGQCVDANTKGQDLRRDGKLTAARELLRQCASASCPVMVRDDCTKRLDELESAQPTIAFEVKDASGSDLSDVQVSVDGKLLADRLDGTALPVDQGSHVFTFTVAGQPPITRTFLLIEGEKRRREQIALGSVSLPVSGAPPASAGSTSAEPEAPARGMGTQKVLGLVAGSAGVAGIVVGGVFGAMTLSEVSQQKSACASATPMACPNPTQAASDHSAGEMDHTISTVGFIAGGVLLVGGAVLFFTARHTSEPRAVTRLVVVPSVGPSGGGMFLKGEF